jgi:uncharacterized membrane protein
MKNKTVWIGGGLIVLATVAYTLWVMPSVPPRIITHWGLDGKPDGWSSKETGLWIGVGAQVFILLLMGLLPRVSPKKARIDEFQGAWNTVTISLMLFFAFFQYLMVRSALGPFDTVRTMMFGMMIMFAVIGNVMGKAKRNYFMGVRTPWTLESEEVWFRTHRLAGKLMVGGAALGLLLLVIGLEPMWTLPIVLIASLYPVLYSYLLYRKLHPNGASA